MKCIKHIRATNKSYYTDKLAGMVVFTHRIVVDKFIDVLKKHLKKIGAKRHKIDKISMSETQFNEWRNDHE